MNQRIKNGWVFYDWANSVYSLVISTAVFPIYYSSVTPDTVFFAGAERPSSAVYSYMLSAAFVIVSIMSPFLSGIADYTGNKKRFLQAFCYLGASACGALYFFDGSNLWFGLSMSVLAGVGFWGSLVFYNAFLPEIATPKEQDALSAKGFSLGYLGSALLLVLNLAIITNPELIGLADSGAASRLSFLSVGIWWAGFAQITFRRLPNNFYHRKPGERYIFKGYEELRSVWMQLKEQQSLRRFLYSFFMYSMGVQTVMLMATLFGEDELGLSSGQLIGTILVIQFLGMAGAHLFSFISKKRGNFTALKISIVIWVLVCLAAYLLQSDDPQVHYKFYAIAAGVGLVMGGIQAISRSTYSKMLPETQSHASYFSFFDVSEKVAIILGTFIYGFLIEYTGNMRLSVLAVSGFFVVGYILLSRVKRTAEVY